MRATDNLIFSPPPPLCLSLSAPHSPLAKARQTMPLNRKAQNEPTAPQKPTRRHNSTSFVQNKATCQNDSPTETQSENQNAPESGQDARNQFAMDIREPHIPPAPAEGGLLMVQSQ